MSKKIYWIEVVPSHEKMAVDVPSTDGCYDMSPAVRMTAVIKGAACEDTEIDFQFLRSSSYSLDNRYIQMLNNTVMIEHIMEAEKQGYDAAVIGCAIDPGLKEARQAVHFPVVSCGEAAMLLACSLGQQFGVVTVQEEIVQLIEDNITSYGLKDRAVPVQTVSLGDNPLGELGLMLADPQRVHPDFDEMARVSIASGAEVIIPGCTAYSSSVYDSGYREVPGTGVPVIDVNQAAVKLAESLIDLHRIGYHRSQSRRSAYSSMPSEMRDHLRALVKGE